MEWRDERVLEAHPTPNVSASSRAHDLSQATRQLVPLRPPRANRPTKLDRTYCMPSKRFSKGGQSARSRMRRYTGVRARCRSARRDATPRRVPASRHRTPDVLYGIAGSCVHLVHCTACAAGHAYALYSVGDWRRARPPRPHHHPPSPSAHHPGASPSSWRGSQTTSGPQIPAAPRTARPRPVQYVGIRFAQAQFNSVACAPHLAPGGGIRSRQRGRDRDRGDRDALPLTFWTLTLGTRRPRRARYACTVPSRHR